MERLVKLEEQRNFEVKDDQLTLIMTYQWQICLIFRDLHFYTFVSEKA